MDIEAWFRKRALVEERIKDSKLGLALRHLTSGYETVNRAWMWTRVVLTANACDESSSGLLPGSPIMLTGSRSTFPQTMPQEPLGGRGVALTGCWPARARSCQRRTRFVEEHSHDRNKDYKIATLDRQRPPVTTPRHNRPLSRSSHRPQ